MIIRLNIWLMSIQFKIMCTTSVFALRLKTFLQRLPAANLVKQRWKFWPHSSSENNGACC